METINKNRFIAEFMGFKPTANGVYPIECPHEGIGFHVETMKYHYSWDWLMPVCKKFDTLNLDKLDHEAYTAYSDAIDNAVTLYEIELVFEILVEAIQWYNSQNKS